MSEDNENKKKDLTVGGVSGSKKMRLGRVHKKKTEDAPEAPVEEVKVEEPKAQEPQTQYAGEMKVKICPECGTKIEYSEGCYICLNCGYSGCS